MTLTPAYGRDYKSVKEVQADLDADKDFIEAVSGRYINKSQLLEMGQAAVNVRYAKLRKVTICKV
jgi:hypothetical protein